MKERMLRGELYRPTNRSCSLQERCASCSIATTPPARRAGRTRRAAARAARPCRRGRRIKPRFAATTARTSHRGRDIRQLRLRDARHRADRARRLVLAGHPGPAARRHPPDRPIPRRDGWEYGAPITIADNVWLGGGAIVCPGVSIGEDTVVGAGAVVTRDLRRASCLGNPRAWCARSATATAWTCRERRQGAPTCSCSASSARRRGRRPASRWRASRAWGSTRRCGSLWAPSARWWTARDASAGGALSWSQERRTPPTRRSRWSSAAAARSRTCPRSWPHRPA